MTHTWHVSPARADAYLDDGVDQVTAVSIEAHVLQCPSCRRLVAERSASPDLAASWARIEAAIDVAPAAIPDRFAARLGLPDQVVRLVAPTRAIRAAGVLAGLGAFLTAALLARSGVVLPGELGRVVFLTIAPLIPLATVVSTLGGTGDPTRELAAAAPMRGLWVTALRAATVLAVTIVAGLLASAVVPGPWIRAVGWLAPSLGVTSLGALLARRLPPIAAAAMTGTAWVGLVSAAAIATDDRLAAFRSTPQLLYLVVAAVAGGAIAVSPSSLDPGSHR